MAWGRNEPLTKEELKAAGLDPEAIQAALAKGVTKDQLDSFKADIQNELKAALSSFKDELLALDVFKPRSNSQGNGGNGSDNPPPPGDNTDELDFVTDPASATKSVAKKAAAEAVAPVTNFVMQQTADNNLDRLKASMSPEEWKVLEKDFMAQWNNEKLPLSFKANRQWVENTIDMVRGRHVDELTEARKKKPFTIESGSANRGDNTHRDIRGGERKVEDLTADEIAQAEAWGLSKEDYLKSSKDLKFVGV